MTVQTVPTDYGRVCLPSIGTGRHFDVMRPLGGGHFDIVP